MKVKEDQALPRLKGLELALQSKGVGSSRYLLDIIKTLGQDLKIPVQRRRYAIRWNRLLAGRFFAALSEALEDVYATIW